jgi:glycosyltransferase domain-containing protein
MKKYITIIIPTHERHDVLRRAIHYYSLINVSVLIADSSEEPYKEKLPNNFDYLHLPSSFFGDKIYSALCNIKTPFTCFCADDDFLTENGLNHGLQFLENHSDYVSVQGQCIQFDSSNLESIEPMYIDCINYKNDSNDILERMKNCFNAPHIFALHRTIDLKNCLEITLGISDVSVVEMCVPLVSLCVGKTKVLPIFWQARDRMRYSKYIDQEGNDYTLNEDSTSNELFSNVVTDWSIYLNSNEGIKFKANFLSKASTLINDSINANDLFNLTFDIHIKKVKNDPSLQSFNDRMRKITKELLPKIIVKKIQEKNIEKFLKLHAKSGFPWNDIAAKNDWKIMKKSIIKFSH